MAEIRKIAPAEIGLLRPLWESLSVHHAEVAPELRALGPLRTPAESWAVRRALYEEWLAAPGSFALLAEIEGRGVGYAVVELRGPEETWETGPVAELETLAVVPGQRGRGIGRELVEAVYAELRRAGVGHLAVAVIAANADAIRFYERLGLLPFLRSFIGPVPASEPS